MSVVPLIIDSLNATVVERREEFFTAGGLNGNVVLIQGIDRTQLLAADNANVSYDLRVGSQYRDHRDANPRDLTEDQEIILHSGTAVIVETEEHVHFPASMFGQIVPKVSMLQRGISNTSSKIDPGYSGPLLITIFNLGKRTIRIRRGERFCSPYILRVETGARPYDKPAKRIQGEPAGGFLYVIRDWMEANSAVIMVVLILATLALTVAQLVSK